MLIFWRIRYLDRNDRQFKEQDRKARLFREKVEVLEVELWKRAGRPEGGPVQFRRDAQEQLDRTLRGGGTS